MEAQATGPENLTGTLQRIGRALVSSLDLKDCLETILDEAREILHAEVAILRLLDRPGEHLEVEVARGVPDEVIRQVRFRPGEGLAGRLLMEGTPLRGINLQRDPRATQRKLARRYNWCAFAAVAIHLHQQPIGVWFLMRKRREPFTDAEMTLFLALADYASLAIERSWLLHTIVREKHEGELAIQASASGILILDGRGRVVDMNPALEQLIGWTLRQARGQPCCDVVGCYPSDGVEGDAMSVCPLLAQSGAGDKAFAEYTIRARDGRAIPVEASYGLIHDEEGDLARMIVVFRDISRQEELNRLRAEIVANVSHELRTPLSLIKGYASTLLSPGVTLDEVNSRRFLNNVSVAADHLSRMIDDLLVASRIETQQLRLQSEAFDLAILARQILVWFEPHAQGRRLVADLSPEELWVWADSDRVRQVLVNLLSNAVKYSPRSSTILVRGRLLDDPPRVVVHVQDEGEGIAAHHLTRIFDRFYLTEKSKKGVGLGLYICRELVEAMEGQIWAVSEVGVGSTFSFTLPARAAGLDDP
ncbi:MAG: ATP-binding protein [Anaerolineae bacterium]